MILRWFEPLPADHPLVEDKSAKCPVCVENFKEGDITGLLPVQKYGEGGMSDKNVMEIAVHRACYLPVVSGNIVELGDPRGYIVTVECTANQIELECPTFCRVCNAGKYEPCSHCQDCKHALKTIPTFEAMPDG